MARSVHTLAMTAAGGQGDDETAPDRESGDQYPGLPAEIRGALEQAAAEARDVWLEARVTEEGQNSDVPIVIDAREGSTVYLRHADPPDPPDPPRVHIRPGDRVVMTTPIAAASVNATAEVGRVDDMITWLRVVLDRREGGKVYARTLRQGEPDDGRRVHVRPGEEFVFEAGAVVVSLDEIDSREPPTETGYVNLAPVLWAWLQFAPPSAESVRYVLAAARRLDAANGLLLSIQRARDNLAVDREAGNVAGPVLRRHFTEMLSSVEMMVVALGRVTDMVCSAGELIACAVPVPGSVDANKDAVRSIRNAYEHIEDRALGQVNKRPDPQALTIFDYTALLAEDAVVYGEYRLGLANEVPDLLTDIRSFLKTVVGGSPTEDHVA